MADEDKPGYDVGYGKPPESTRFLKGQSGNPKGRPKGSKNFSSALESELKVLLVSTENGKRKTISKREAIAKRIVNSGVAGNLKVMPILLNEIRQLESKANGVEPPAELTNQNAEETMKRALERFMRTTEASKAPVQEQQPAQEAPPGNAEDTPVTDNKGDNQ